MFVVPLHLISLYPSLSHTLSHTPTHFIGTSQSPKMFFASSSLGHLSGQRPSSLSAPSPHLGCSALQVCSLWERQYVSRIPSQPSLLDHHNHWGQTVAKQEPGYLLYRWDMETLKGEGTSPRAQGW